MKNHNRAVWFFFDLEDMNRVLLRLAAAGWLYDTSRETAQTLRVRYSKDGNLRMCELSLLLMSYHPRLFGISPTTPKPKAAMFFEAIFNSPSIAPELVSLPLTEREQWAFIELLSLLAMRNLKGVKDEPATTGQS
jgi:hypothetical protein